MANIPESSGIVLPRTSKGLKDLRTLRSEVFPTGVLAYTLLRCEAALRNMCFIDNEFGQAEQERIEAIAFRCMNIVNAALAARHRLIRVFAITPWPKRHHHIQVEWGYIPHIDEDGNQIPMRHLEPLVANLYMPSKRVQEEEEERVGPRRGEKLKRPKRESRGAKKPRREYHNDLDLDARDTGGEIESSPMMGSEADAAPTQNQTEIKNDFSRSELASA